MSSNTFLIDAASRHSVLVQRYSNGLESGVESDIKKALIKVGKIIEELYSPDLSKSRLERLQKQIVELLSGEYKSIFNGLNEDLNDFIESEIEFNQVMFQESVGDDVEVKEPRLPAAIRSFNQTLMTVDVGSQITPQEALKQYGKAKIKQVNQAVKDGYTEGKTHQQLQKEIRSLIPLQARQAGSVVRTLTNTASSMARFEHMFGNLDIFSGYEWVSTLDSRTSLICMGRDGKKYKFKKSSPIPPAHWSACAEGVKVETIYGNKNIEDVKVGDYVKTHTGSYKKVTAVMAKRHKGKMAELIDNFGHRVSLTDDHPILTSNGYTNVSDIDKGTRVFNSFNKFSNLKYWAFGAIIENRILINAHNLKTKCAERLVAYEVTSLTAGVSSAIKLNKYVLSKSKISNIISRIKLVLKLNA